MPKLNLWGAVSLLAVAIAAQAYVDYRRDRSMSRRLNAIITMQLTQGEHINAISAMSASRGDALKKVAETQAAIQAAVQEAQQRLEHAEGTKDVELTELVEKIRIKNIRVPAVNNLEWANLNGNQIKILTQPLNYGADALGELSLRSPATEKAPTGKLEFPLPDVYVNIFKQPFAPYHFAQNAAFIAQQIRTGNHGWDDQIGPLLTQLAKYTNSRDEVFYEFKQYIYDGVLQSGWTSAFGNALVVVGLTELFEATQDPQYRALARKYVIPLTSGYKDREIVRIDASDFLWFEETPPLNGKPVSVYNGHTGTVIALYHYQKLTGDNSVEPYIRAGLATSARYLPESRQPGGPPSYSRYSDVPDYGPLRALNQVNFLWKITGDNGFKQLAEELKTDVPYR